MLISTLKAQPDLALPSKMQLIVDGSKIILTQGWIDSLVNEAKAWKIFYKIVGASRANSSVTTQVQVPQIFSLDEVYRQIVLYYAILPDEDVRESEFLNIYPYFKSTREVPAIKCKYLSEGKYEIEIEYWYQIPVPDRPSVEDREIYDQIIQTAFHEVQSFGDVADSVFEKVAEKNKLPAERIKEIYQNRILWQLSNQIY